MDDKHGNPWLESIPSMFNKVGSPALKQQLEPLGRRPQLKECQTVVTPCNSKYEKMKRLRQHTESDNFGGISILIFFCANLRLAQKTTLSTTIDHYSNQLWLLTIINHWLMITYHYTIDQFKSPIYQSLDNFQAETHPKTHWLSFCSRRTPTNLARFRGHLWGAHRGKINFRRDVRPDRLREVYWWAGPARHVMTCIGLQGMAFFEPKCSYLLTWCSQAKQCGPCMKIIAGVKPTLKMTQIMRFYLGWHSWHFNM